MTEEFFVLQNLGYDGILLKKYTDQEAALQEYQRLIKEEANFDKRYPGLSEGHKGTAVIQGRIIISDSPEALFDEQEAK